MQLLGLKHYVRWFTVSTLLALGTACSQQSSDEQRLRQAVTAMQTAAEARQIRPILAYLAEDFQGNGQYRKANLGGLLLLHYRQNQHVQVVLRITDLQLNGDQAKLRCRVLLAGRDEKIVPERVRVLVIDSEWRRRDGEWRVLKANWRDGLDQP